MLRNVTMAAIMAMVATVAALAPAHTPDAVADTAPEVGTPETATPEVYAPAVETTLNGCFVVAITPITSERQVSELLNAGWTGDPTDGKEALYNPECFEMPRLAGLTDAELVEAINSTPDNTRWFMDAVGNLPMAPEGYAYAEDHTLVPLDYWSNPGMA